MPTQLANPLVTVNNDPVGVIPNSVVFTEGLGEQKTRAVSRGGKNVEQIYSIDLESGFSMVKFEIPATVSSISQAREWKSNDNKNVVQIVGETPEGVITRTFTQASLLNNYEVPLGSETNISIEFTSNSAV